MLRTAACARRVVLPPENVCTCRQPSAGGKVLTGKIDDILGGILEQAEKTVSNYAAPAVHFITWLHLRHPECFRQTPVRPIRMRVRMPTPCAGSGTHA